MDKKLDILPPGESIPDALAAMSRLTRRAKLRALVAKRKYEREKSQVNEHNWMLAAQEYYYAAALTSDFTRAINEHLAKQIHEKNVKNSSVN
jgi:hypothetical protein